MAEALRTGATIGMLGGGQLGRMLAVAAARLGYRTHVFDPGDAPPAGDVAHRVTRAAFEDARALREFARAVDVITYEFENIPAEALDVLETIRKVLPGRLALTTSQDRLVEKTFLQGLGLPVAPFAPVTDAGSLAVAVDRVGLPAILKTARLGYDGKGQALIATPQDAGAALAAMQGAPAVLEGFVRFDREISVIVARGADGQVVAYDPGSNVHQGGILRTTTVPADVSLSVTQNAVLIAGRVVNSLDYVGVLGIEFFVTGSELIVNEIAPRVHNSGHWTQNGCVVDQFEQHIRAIAGWPLGSGARHADVVMENLIGADVARVGQLGTDPDVAIHLYGKTEVRDGRKMGHVNRVVRQA